MHEIFGQLVCDLASSVPVVEWLLKNLIILMSVGSRDPCMWVTPDLKWVVKQVIFLFTVARQKNDFEEDPT